MQENSFVEKMKLGHEMLLHLNMQKKTYSTILIKDIYPCPPTLTTPTLRPLHTHPTHTNTHTLPSVLASSTELW